MDESTIQTIFNYLVSQEQINLRMAGAVFLKQYLANYWMDNTEKCLENPNKKLSENVKGIFKSNILILLLNADKTLFPTIMEMIIKVVASAGGYYNIWPNLMSDLKKILDQNDMVKSNEIYHLISKVIKRYHIESRSDSLFSEIVKTIDTIAAKLTNDAQRILGLLEKGEIRNTQELNTTLLMMRRIFSIFYSLNFQDFPYYFEDNLETWMNIFKRALVIQLQQLPPDVEENLMKFRAKLLKCLNLYYSSYFEDFFKYAQDFYPLVWNYLDIIKNDDNFSPLMKQLITFFDTNFKAGRFAQIPVENVKTIIDTLIIKNMSLSEKEMEEFEDNPTNFIKIEMEEADMDSNKFFAIQLLQHILEHKPELAQAQIQPMILNFLNQYNSNKNTYWNQKISAINLLLAVSIQTFAQRSKFIFYFISFSWSYSVKSKFRT